MLKKLIGILLIAVSVSLFSTEKYAVLITGDYAAPNYPVDAAKPDDYVLNEDGEYVRSQNPHPSFWNDTYLMWEMLIQKGYKDENIFVLFAGGTDYWDEPDVQLAKRYTPQNIYPQDPEFTITDASATYAEVERVAGELQGKLTKDDFLFVWTWDHGATQWNPVTQEMEGTIRLIDPDDPLGYVVMSDVYFASIFEPIEANKKVYWMGQCESGYFKDNLEGEDTYFNSSAGLTPSTYADDFYPDFDNPGEYILEEYSENDVIDNISYRHGEFNFHMYSATSGLKPDGSDNYHGETYESADINSDLLVSIDETRIWGADHHSSFIAPDWQTDWAPIYSDLGNIGFHTSLEYPTLLHSPLNNGGYARNFGLKGIVALVNDMHIETDMVQYWDELIFEDYSHTTFLENIDLSISDLGDVTFGNNTVIEGKGNGSITMGGYYSDLNVNNTTFKSMNIDQETTSFIKITDNITLENTKWENHGAFITRGTGTDVYGNISLTEGSELLLHTTNQELSLGEFYHLSMDISNSTLILNDQEILEAFPITVTDGGRIVISNEELRALPEETPKYDAVFLHNDINMTGSSVYEVMSNAGVYQYSHLNISDGATLQIDENGGIATTLNMGDYSNVLLYNNSRFVGNLTANNGCKVELQENSVFHIETGITFTLKSGSVLRLLAGSELILDDGANLILEPGARIEVEGNAKLTGDYTLPGLAKIDLLENSSLTINGSSTLYLDGKSEINGLTGSSLIVGQYSSLETTIEPDYSDITENDFINMTGSNWKGIICEPNSSIKLVRTRISGAEYAINGMPNKLMYIGEYSCLIEQCEISNCENGINITSSSNMKIANNTLNGIDAGSGISLTQTNGEITGNIVDNFNRGLRVISGSPIVTRNTLSNNRYSGFYTAGLNSYAQLVDPIKYSVVNNHIVHNGEIMLDGSSYPMSRLPSQIGVVSFSNVYMDYGRNNIISYNGIVPRVATISLIEEGEIPRPEPIYARGNYWGVATPTSSIFSVGGSYYLVYDPWSSREFGAEPQTSPLPDPDSKSWDLLQKALIAELDGKYDKAIKTYEKIIDKYPDSKETLIAYAKLPDNYVQEEMDLEPLARTFDEIAESTDDKYLKKFFKEMKVTAKLKGKKYDEAIILSEEMILEAETEEEEILCEIDIAICNMLKDSESKGKSSIDRTKALNNLLDKLNGDGQEEEVKTEIVESALPTEFALYQNYPNPFNPTTEIRFALPTASDVKLNVYNINGQLVSELVNGSKEVGLHSVNFDASNFNSGMYFYTLEANGLSVSKKMILTK
ncbi:MAG: T9SS type A sorting domain-containing protein [Candidatus Delongbacteria bacterium]|nr:T9SS type A sorting domain-containing protein [Candidatus Delongbacteria bacterium]